jgi:beta-lactamase class A
MKRLWVLVLIFALIENSSAQNAKSGLTRLLDAQLARFPAKAGVYVKHLQSGEEAGVRADEEFSTRSVIKIPIMLLAFQLIDQKKLNLDTRVELRKEDMRGGSGIFSAHDPGLNPTIRDVITEMIITSDNTATDIMIRHVGGVDRVNEWITMAGYTKSKLIQTIDVLFKKRDVKAPSRRSRAVTK